MADLADVEDALANALTACLYPNGLALESAVLVPIRVNRGQPTNATLIAARSDNIINVGVSAKKNSSCNTTRWGVQVALLPNVATLSVGVSGNAATFSGLASAGDVAGVLANGQVFIYQATEGDGGALVAAALTDAIRLVEPCWLVDATLTVPGAYELIARTASKVTAIEEWSRQRQGFEVSIWASTPSLRDSVGKIITSTLSQIGFLSLADGTAGRIRYEGSNNFDQEQAASIYCRVIDYTIEYGTTNITSNPTMLFGDLLLNGTPIYA